MAGASWLSREYRMPEKVPVWYSQSAESGFVSSTGLGPAPRGGVLSPRMNSGTASGTRPARAERSSKRIS